MPAARLVPSPILIDQVRDVPRPGLSTNVGNRPLTITRPDRFRIDQRRYPVSGTVPVLRAPICVVA